MAHRLRAALVGAIVCAISVPAHAAATEFGYVYTAETEEAGETEVSLWATDRRGKGDGHYDAQDYKLEVERGITDRFGVSAYAKFASHHIHGLGGEFERVDRNFAFQGLSAEFKYKLLDPSHDHFGAGLLRRARLVTDQQDQGRTRA